MGLTDAQWTVLAPLIEQCRPRAKVPPRHLRRTISAIIGRHDNGATWRALLDRLPRSGGVGSEHHAAARMVPPSMPARASAGVR